MRRLLTTTALAGFSLLVTNGGAQAQDINPSELLNLSLEQLSNIEVTSVSKRAEKANEAAAAIFVVTQDDIRRSGATSIPEVLRMVPGLSVAQSGSHGWAISARGFNDEFSNKLLVLIDGRTVYTPLFSGVYWDVQDTLMEDIERIEVIRGPGATLWGANAVNGVINIITKTAENTQGGLASLTAGNQDRALGRTRYGAKLGDNAHVRVYAKYDEHDELRTLADAGAGDEWNKDQAGFRVDGKIGARSSYTLQGDIYRAGENGITSVPIPTGALPATYITQKDRETDRGGNVLGRWNQNLSKDSDLTVQLYYDNARRNNAIYGSDTDTFDLDVQHTWTPLQGHEVVWGGGYRLVNIDTSGNTYLQFTDSHHSDNLYSAFVQDKIAIVPDKFFITLGSKFELNDYTGFEYQPSGRFTWLINDNQTLWGSISRAVHTPDRGTANDLQLLIADALFFGPGVYAGRIGNDALKSEELVAYELGYRIQPAPNVSLDIATFYNDYDNLVLGSLGTPYATSSPVLGPFGVFPALPINGGTAHSWGVETSAKWNPASYLELTAGYTLLELKFDQSDPYGFSFAGKAPQQQFNLRSTVFLPHNLEFDTSLYYVDSLQFLDPTTGTSFPDYARLDVRLAWKPIESIEVSLVGQNLLDPEHPEFSPFLYRSSSQVPRSFYGNITWKF